MALWTQYDNGSRLMSKRFTRGSGWGTAALVNTDGGTGGVGTLPHIAMQAGNAVAVWISNDPAGNHVKANVLE